MNPLKRSNPFGQPPYNTDRIVHTQYDERLPPERTIGYQVNGSVPWQFVLKPSYKEPDVEDSNFFIHHIHFIEIPRAIRTNLDNFTHKTYCLSRLNVELATNPHKYEHWWQVFERWSFMGVLKAQMPTLSMSSTKTRVAQYDIWKRTHVLNYWDCRHCSRGVIDGDQVGLELVRMKKSEIFDNVAPRHSDDQVWQFIPVVLTDPSYEPQGPIVPVGIVRARYRRTDSHPYQRQMSMYKLLHRENMENEREIARLCNDVNQLEIFVRCSTIVS